MPSRIYDIATKLGLDYKQVLAKAQALGISAARVASSSLDKITAEYLEQQLLSDKSLPNSQTPLQQLGVAITQDAAAPTSIMIKAISPELHALVEKILSGQIPFTMEIARQDGLPPLRAKLVEVAADVVSEPQMFKSMTPLPRAELDERTKDLFRAAYFSARHVSRDEWVNLAEYGSALKRQDPTFQPQDFGERSLGGLVRRMMDDFEIRANESTPPVHYIRMRSPSGPQRYRTEPALSVAEPPGPKQTAKGRIHNLKLGFGFIAPDDGSQNAFFHASEVQGCTIFDLRPGDPVEYEAGFNERGPCGSKVRRVGDELADVKHKPAENLGEPEGSTVSALAPNGTFFTQQRRQSVHPAEVRVGTAALRIIRANQIPVVVANWILAQGKSLPLIANFVQDKDLGFARSAQTKQLDNGWYIEIGDSFETLLQKGRRLLDTSGFRQLTLQVILEDGTARTA